MATRNRSTQTKDGGGPFKRTPLEPGSSENHWSFTKVGRSEALRGECGPRFKARRGQPFPMHAISVKRQNSGSAHDIPHKSESIERIPGKGLPAG